MAQRMGKVAYFRSEAKHPHLGNAIWRPRLITKGAIRTKPEAFVYVGVRQERIKIGMSSNPLSRCRSLGADLTFTVPVVVAAAKMVETYALQQLGARQGDGEWVVCTIDEAIDAVCVAWMTAGRAVHVNPLITDEEARLDRVRAAA